MFKGFWPVGMSHKCALQIIILPGLLLTWILETCIHDYASKFSNDCYLKKLERSKPGKPGKPGGLKFTFKMMINKSAVQGHTHLQVTWISIILLSVYNKMEMGTLFWEHLPAEGSCERGSDWKTQFPWSCGIQHVAKEGIDHMIFPTF